ncbi:MAG: DUF3604 domain-containing protein, partial [Thermoanaerobaculales bacterium]|nr:DUF3604 domain-containing protein [Thermoanaerobaculales bacterium]
MRDHRTIVCLFAVILVAGAAGAQHMDLSAEPEDVTFGQAEYSPYLHRGYPQRVFWGDTHTHTSYSTDAGMIGCTLGPEDAYRFARGEIVVASGGVRARLQRPLDFLVVADHAENLGLAPMIAEANSDLLRTEFGREIFDLVQSGDYGAAYKLWGTAMSAGEDPLAGQDGLTRSMWGRVTEAAEKYNQPGVFTAFIGFEWTSSPGGNNLHRNVVFRDGKDDADRVLPFSNYDSTDPEDLWRWMAAYEEKTGGSMLAIPHNGNLSNGLMFDETTMSNEPLTRAYAETRMRREPIYEITQIKGDGEAHPLLSPDDEFADYGTWDKGSFGPEPKTEDMLLREYAREAFKRGLAYETALGANPFKFGVVGSTDTHTALATTQEDNYFGKATPAEPSAGDDRFNETITGYFQEEGGPDITIRHMQTVAAGLAAVWARENTREAIFDAMQRREVYATTGTRITVRVFAGWDFEADDIHLPDFAHLGYTRGVPMGGDIEEAPEGSTPKLVIRALRDPDGANLDRVQVVKGWLDESGELEERVYDVAVSDGREISADGRCTTPVG